MCRENSSHVIYNYSKYWLMVGAFGKLWVRNSLMPRGGIKIQGTLCMREIYRGTENLKIKLYKKNLCIIYCSIYQYQVSQVNPKFDL